MGGDLYDGIPTVEVLIDKVDVPDPEHLRRSQRYVGKVDLDVAAAVEAARDEKGLIARDPRSRTGEAIRVIGYSATAGRVLVVVLLPAEHPPIGHWYVVTAWPANRKLRDAYIAEENGS